MTRAFDAYSNTRARYVRVRVRVCSTTSTTTSDGRWATNDDDGGDRVVVYVVVYVVVVYVVERVSTHLVRRHACDSTPVVVSVVVRDTHSRERVRRARNNHPRPRARIDRSDLPRK